MRAIVIQAFGDPEQLVERQLPVPRPESGEALIRVRAFGLNRAETYMRRGQWGEVAKVSGIECVGEIVEDGSGRFGDGQTVAAIMGGMGRTRNGSYAEFTCLPVDNIVALETELDWAALAAIPESYATAWSCLHGNMKLRAGDRVLIRGGTSALGQAAINIAAHNETVRVLATTRDPQRAAFLKALGCAEVFIEQPNLSGEIRTRYPEGLSSVMDIVGNSTLLDSLRMVKRDGTVCNAGFLGGGDPLRFNPLTDLPCSVNLNFFASFMLGTAQFPLSEIPLQEIVERVAGGIYQAGPARVFGFDDIVQAHRLMEANQANGKLVVTL